MSTRCFTIYKIYKYSILFHHFVEFITSLVISFAQYKEYVICLISLSKCSDALPSFTCAKVVDNAWSICLVVSILIRLRPIPYGQKRLLRMLSLKEIFAFLLFIEVQDFFNNIKYFIWIFIFSNLFTINRVS